MKYRAGNRFTPSCRLHSRKEFDLIWKGGQKIHVSHFFIIILQKNCGPTRLGLTVSRKIGGAVARNKVKRRLREYFRLTYDMFPSSVDVLVVAKKGAASLSSEMIANELDILKSLRPIQSAS